MTVAGRYRRWKRSLQPKSGWVWLRHSSDPDESPEILDLASGATFYMTRNKSWPMEGGPACAVTFGLFVRTADGEDRFCHQWRRVEDPDAAWPNLAKWVQEIEVMV